MHPCPTGPGSARSEWTAQPVECLGGGAERTRCLSRLDVAGWPSRAGERLSRRDRRGTQNGRARKSTGCRLSTMIIATLLSLAEGNDLPAADYFQDYFSNGFAYDGGSSSSWGTRVALREKLNDDMELTALYAFGGALTPYQRGRRSAARRASAPPQRHSLGAKYFREGAAPRHAGSTPDTSGSAGRRSPAWTLTANPSSRWILTCTCGDPPAAAQVCAWAAGRQSPNATISWRKAMSP